MFPEQVFIIAEAGVNHNGSLDRAKEMVRSASEAGADAVKFQSFTAQTLVTKGAQKADYQKKNAVRDESQFEMLRKLELSYEAHLELIEVCESNHIEFLSSPFDLSTIDLLKKIGIKKWKIPSGEISNLPYLRKIASFGQQIILSTGMSDLDDIRSALAVFTGCNIPIEMITVLHCNTQYPTPVWDVNLKAMQTIESTFPGVKIGYSDHTQGIEIPIAAVAMGASMLEKHFTLDKQLPGPDHRASLCVNELKQMVNAVRCVEKAMGDGVKQPSPSEKENILIARKSIVAACDIDIGETFSNDNLTAKRPGSGLSPMRWDDIMGKKAHKKYKKDDLIDA